MNTPVSSHSVLFCSLLSLSTASSCRGISLYYKHSLLYWIFPVNMCENSNLIMHWLHLPQLFSFPCFKQTLTLPFNSTKSLNHFRYNKTMIRTEFNRDVVAGNIVKVFQYFHFLLLLVLVCFSLSNCFFIFNSILWLYYEIYANSSWDLSYDIHYRIKISWQSLTY